MADLGAVGRSDGFSYSVGLVPPGIIGSALNVVLASYSIAQFPPNQAKIISADGHELLAFCSRENADGSLTPPSLCLGGNGRFRFRWAMSAALHTVSVWVKQSSDGSPRPRLVVKSNATIGVPSDLTSDAPSGSGWVQIPPVSVSPNSSGAVWVELHNRRPGFDPCFFDRISVT